MSSGPAPIGEGLLGETALKATIYARGLSNVSALALDGQGRLFAATAAYSDAGQDGIYLVDRAGSTPVRVISGVSTPLGLLWSGGTLYVSSRGVVEAYGGLNGTGFSSRRQLVGFPSGSGELNNMVLSPDGRIVLGISAPCDHCIPESPWSAAIVSFKQDGTDLRIEASGIRAPVGLAYDGQGRLLATMNQRDDLGSKTPGDWLAVINRGQSWGFPACYGQGGAGCSAQPVPLAVLDPHGVAGGVALFGGQALVAEWAKGKVLGVDLGTHAVTTWLSGLKQPLPVLASPDGSVLVGDWKTGVIYRIAKR